MPTTKEIINLLDSRLETVPDALFEAVGVTQDELLRSLLGLIDQLDTKNGVITTSPNNTRILQSIDAEINRVLFSDGATYVEALSKYAAEVIEQGGLIKSYFSSSINKYTDKEVYDDVIRNVTNNAIDQLTQTSVDAIFNKPLKQIVNQSFTTGVTRSQINDSLRQFIKGQGLEGEPKVEGKLLRYVKQVGRDAFSAADRQVSTFIAEDLELKWYLYAGDKIKDSRKFCVQRVGKFFHRNEIESWVTMDWQGKAPVNEATIFTLLGGYNCIHRLLPVSEKAVPQEYIDSAKLKGFI